MNIITKSDKKKFIALLKAGLKKGIGLEMETHSSRSVMDEDVNYVSLGLKFKIKQEDVEHITAEDLVDNEIDELLK